MENTKYRIFVENLDTKKILCQDINNNWQPPNINTEWNIYTEIGAINYCQESNNSTYALHNGLHYFYKEYLI